MTLLTLATSTDIIRWAATRAAQERMPELIRRLVYATTDGPTYVDFPSGDAVQLEGWDGAVELQEDHPVVPRDRSVWEIGTDQKVKGKADSDYEKRTAAPPPTGRGPVIPAETTFVFATPRRWGAKAKWATARRAEQKWKDVRVLDAVDLEAWLLLAPATHVWLSRVMNLVPAGVSDLETTWADWAEGTTPVTSTQLILASREAEAAQIVGWMQAPARGLLTVSAGSSDEALGVVGAATMALPEATRAPILARTAVVTSTDALAQLAGSEAAMTIIVKYAAGHEVQRAIRGGHRVIVPTGPIPGGAASTNRISIPRIRRHDAEAALIALNIPARRARDLAGVARRSMLTLRRRLATNPALETPVWASAVEGPALVPMLLLGQFDESQDADLQALSALLTTDLNGARRVLQRWAQEADAPIRRVGNVWYLVSKEDAWDMLSRYVSPQDITRFAAVAKDVLGEVHPKFDLPAEDRWVASIHGKVRQYSGTLAAGVADTIALLGALDNSVTLQGGVSPASVASGIARDLFETIAGDWRGWATLSPVLPLLAEGAPDVILHAIESQIANDPPAVQTLFGDEGDVMFSSSPHTGILWALETLAWSPDYLAHTARLLAALDRADPGGRISNRPRNSLRSIFLGWLPQTSADLDTRLAVLDGLRRREPEAARRLFASLLPQINDTSGSNPRPAWRDWVAEGAGEGATYNDIFRQTAALVGWMVTDAGEDPASWVTLIEALGNIGPNEFEAITAGLAKVLAGDASDTLRAPIADALRGLLSQHRSFADAEWSLPEDRLLPLEPLLDSATPADPVARLSWLFSHHPQLPEGREDDFEAHRAVVQQRQEAAVDELYHAIGTEGLVALAVRVDLPDEVGRFLAKHALLSTDEEIALLNRTLTATDHPTRSFGRGFANGWTVRVGVAAALVHVQDLGAPLSDQTRGRLLLSHDMSQKTLDVVDALSAPAQEAFWTSMNPFWLEGDQIERGFRAMLRFGRSHALIDAAAMHLRKHPYLDPEMLAAALEHAPTQRADPDGRRMTAHDIGVVLDALERAAAEARFKEAEVAKLEFLYLGILGHFNRPPRILHRAIASDATLFVEAVRVAYQKGGTDDVQAEAGKRQLAERAYRLLDSWREPPGWSNGIMDAGAMNAWVDSAQGQLDAIGKREIGQTLIGMAMSGLPTDADGAWPLIPVRELMERIASQEFDNGLRIGRFNGRGVITRDPLGGGALERGVAEGYEAMASIATTRWPRTAAMLRLMARHARSDAAREDDESTLREDLEE